MDVVATDLQQITHLPSQTNFFLIPSSSRTEVLHTAGLTLAECQQGLNWIPCLFHQ